MKKKIKWIWLVASIIAVALLFGGYETPNITNDLEESMPGEWFTFLGPNAVPVKIRVFKAGAGAGHWPQKAGRAGHGGYDYKLDDRDNAGDGGCVGGGVVYLEFVTDDGMIINTAGSSFRYENFKEEKSRK
jgi:hypothetical protein